MRIARSASAAACTGGGPTIAHPLAEPLAMLQLHYFPGNASLIPHLVLEELGVPFEL